MEVWPFIPQSRIEESLEWLTSIQRCKSAEYRQALRYTPRQEFICNYVMTESQFSRALTIARATDAPSVLLPIWTDWLLCPPLLATDTTITIDTSLTDISALSYVIIWDSDTSYEVHEVTSNIGGVITLATPIVVSRHRALLIPLRIADFAQEFEATRGAHTTIKSTARFRLMDVPYLGSIENFGYSTYKSTPVVTSRSIVAPTLSEQFTREYEEIDPGFGIVARFPLTTKPKQEGEHTWSVQNRTDRRKLFGWLHSRRGQFKSFFVPSWNNDFTLASNIGASSTTIDVVDTNIRGTATFPFDIMIRTTSGLRNFKRVLSAVASITPNCETLTIDEAYGSIVTVAEVDVFSRLVKVRFAADRAEIAHGIDGAARVSMPLVEVPL